MRQGLRSAVLKSDQLQRRVTIVPSSVFPLPIFVVTSRFQVPTLKIAARAGQIAPYSRTPEDSECFCPRL